MTDLAAQLDAHRIAVGKVEALATVVEEQLDNASWPGADPLQLDHLAHLISTVADAATTATAAVDRFRGAVTDIQPARGGGQWEK